MAGQPGAARKIHQRVKDWSLRLLMLPVVIVLLAYRFVRRTVKHWMDPDA